MTATKIPKYSTYYDVKSRHLTTHFLNFAQEKGLKRFLLNQNSCHLVFWWSDDEPVWTSTRSTTSQQRAAQRSKTERLFRWGGMHISLIPGSVLAKQSHTHTLWSILSLFYDQWNTTNKRALCCCCQEVAIGFTSAHIWNVWFGCARESEHTTGHVCPVVWPRL